MGFSGKATFSAGADIPEIAEDVTDVVSVVSPFETPLLDHLGDSPRSAHSTVHEWLEDTLLFNFDTLNQTTFTPNPQDATVLTVANGSRFLPGDLLKPHGSSEVMQVTNVGGNTITVVRRFGSTPATTLVNGLRLNILGNAALEGADANQARFTARVRKQNYTQIFSATCEVTDTMKAVRTIGVDDELDFQKQERLRELLRDLENCVINGAAPAVAPQGSPTVRRSMNGIIKMLNTNVFAPGVNGFPGGSGPGTELNENVLNAALRAIWEQSSGRVDTIVVNGAQKRRINQFITTAQRHFTPEDRRISEIVSVYESDFGTCRVVLSRWMPTDSVLFLDSSRVNVMPLAGRTFQYRSLAKTGDATAGQIVGEYTLELRNENAHGMVRGLSAA
jgi:hypothetical protein